MTKDETKELAITKLQTPAVTSGAGRLLSVIMDEALEIAREKSVSDIVWCREKYKHGIYEGQWQDGKPHGKGKYTNPKGEVYEGKFKYGSIKIKLDKKTRNIIKLKPETGLETYSEIKGKGNLSNKWFEAEKVSGTYVLTAKGLKEMKAAEQAMKGGNDGGGGGGGC